jgi:hypothetical protein
MPVQDTEWREVLGRLGELVSLASALDYQLNHVTIEILVLAKSPMIEAVVATLDPPRKIEILKGYIKHIRNHEWRKATEKYLDRVEKVMRARNIACHQTITRKEGAFIFTAPAAAKLLKSLRLDKKPRVEWQKANDIFDSISTAEQALGLGQNLIENFQRMNSERQRRLQHNPEKHS